MVAFNMLHIKIFRRNFGSFRKKSRNIARKKTLRKVHKYKGFLFILRTCTYLEANFAFVLGKDTKTF
jgi:hypothetical protein